MIGEVSLKTKNMSIGYSTLAYWFDKESLDNGLATEAIKCFIRYIFKNMNAKRIELKIAELNTKGLKLALEVGFMNEGRLEKDTKNFITHEIMASIVFAITELTMLNKPITH